MFTTKAQSSRSILSKPWPFVIALLAASILLTPWTPTVRAQGGGPLLLVAVSGGFGELTAQRLQAQLDRLLSGYGVRWRSAPIYSEGFARRLGQQIGAALVVWSPPDTPTAFHNIPVAPGAFVPVESGSVAFTLDRSDARTVAAYLRATVGQAAALIGACDPALQTLERALRLAPEGWEGLAEAHYYRGACHVQQGDLEAALEDFAAAAEAGDAWWYPAALGWTHYNLGETRQAVAALDAAIELAPQNADLYLDRAFFHEARGEAEEAISDYTAVIALRPANPEPYRRRAELYFSQGDFQAALDDHNVLVRLLPDDPYALAGRAEVHLALQHYEDALDDLQAALALDPPQRDSILFLRGLAYLYLGDFPAAIADFQDYTALRPEDPAGWINLGQAQQDMGHPFAAAEAYETALLLDPTATYLYSTLSELYYDIALMPETGPLMATVYLYSSIEDADQALAANPADSHAHLFRGLAYMTLERNENALEDFSAAIRLDPALEDAYYNRGIVYTRLGDLALDDAESERLYRAAIADYDALMALDFDQYAYLLPYQAYLHVNVRDFTAALERFETYDQTAPNAFHDQAYFYYLGRTYAGLGRFEQALDAYAAALEGDTGWYTCYARLGLGVLLGNQYGDTASGVVHLERYLADRCTDNPILIAITHGYLAAWQ